MLTTSSLTSNKSGSAKDNINGVGGGKMIVEANNKKSKSEFLIPRTRLAFAELRQAFNKALILYHFDPECYI